MAMMSSNILNLLLFKLKIDDDSEEYYAVDVDKIYEIRAVEKITRIPDSRLITGIMNLRGKIISVIDIKSILGFSSIKIEKGRILIADVNGVMLGLLVDDVEQVAKVSSESIDYNAAILDNIPYVKGIIKMQDRLVVYIDLDKLLSNGGGIHQ
jgi:purine-binding chemotaxis protein CheW